VYVELVSMQMEISRVLVLWDFLDSLRLWRQWIVLSLRCSMMSLKLSQMIMDRYVVMINE